MVHWSDEMWGWGRLVFKGPMPTFMLMETLTLIEGNMLAGVCPWVGDPWLPGVGCSG